MDEGGVGVGVVVDDDDDDSGGGGVAYVLGQLFMAKWMVRQIVEETECCYDSLPVHIRVAFFGSLALALIFWVRELFVARRAQRRPQDWNDAKLVNDKLRGLKNMMVSAWIVHSCQHNYKSGQIANCNPARSYWWVARRTELQISSSLRCQKNKTKNEWAAVKVSLASVKLAYPPSAPTFAAVCAAEPMMPAATLLGCTALAIILQEP